jgi:hypothetical protein
LTVPTLFGVAVSSLPPQRFATGSGAVNMIRADRYHGRCLRSRGRGRHTPHGERGPRRVPARPAYRRSDLTGLRTDRRSAPPSQPGGRTKADRGPGRTSRRPVTRPHKPDPSRRRTRTSHAQGQDRASHNTFATEPATRK